MKVCTGIYSQNEHLQRQLDNFHIFKLAANMGNNQFVQLNKIVGKQCNVHKFTTKLLFGLRQFK